MTPPVFVLVSRPPGSGTSTLATMLAAALEVPLVAKDTIKDALMAVLPVADLDASRRLGRAAVVAMVAVAAESPIGAVVDCNLHRSTGVDDLCGLSGPSVEVFCRCDRERAWERYQARCGSRHAGHFDDVRTIDDVSHDDVTEPVAGGWPVLETTPTRPSTWPPLSSRFVTSWAERRRRSEHPPMC